MARSRDIRVHVCPLPSETLPVVPELERVVLILAELARGGLGGCLTRHRDCNAINKQLHPIAARFVCLSRKEAVLLVVSVEMAGLMVNIFAAQ